MFDLFQIDRIAAPTHTFLSHIKHNVQLCLRCQLEQDNLRLPTSQYKRWWWESARHIINLKRFLTRHKLLPTQKLKQVTQKHIVSSFLASSNSYKIDEIAAQYNVGSKYPVFPKLRLTRESKFVKVQVPVTVTTVEFPEYCVFCTK